MSEVDIDLIVVSILFDVFGISNQYLIALNIVDDNHLFNALCWRPIILLIIQRLGHQFNVKTMSYQYRKSHCGDKILQKMVSFPNRISYTGKTSSLYWFRTRDVFNN